MLHPPSGEGLTHPVPCFTGASRFHLLASCGHEAITALYSSCNREGSPLTQSAMSPETELQEVTLGHIYLRPLLDTQVDVSTVRGLHGPEVWKTGLDVITKVLS